MTETRKRILAGIGLFAVLIVIAFQVGRQAHAQAEPQSESKQKTEKAIAPVEHQDVIVVPDIWPANLADEIHKLNDKGKTVGKGDITIGPDGKMMIWLMDSPGEDE